LGAVTLAGLVGDILVDWGMDHWYFIDKQLFYRKVKAKLRGVSSAWILP
jgi:hypothetical protein